MPMRRNLVALDLAEEQGAKREYTRLFDMLIRDAAKLAVG
jgi:hypothetical protein